MRGAGVAGRKTANGEVTGDKQIIAGAAPRSRACSTSSLSFKHAGDWSARDHDPP